MNKDNGGPVFPVLKDQGITTDVGMPILDTDHPGMTLRDWFAGQVLGRSPINAYDHEAKAKWAYTTADAMIKEGQK